MLVNKIGPRIVNTLYESCLLKHYIFEKNIRCCMVAFGYFIEAASGVETRRGYSQPSEVLTLFAVT